MPLDEHADHNRLVGPVHHDPVHRNAGRVRATDREAHGDDHVHARHSSEWHHDAGTIARGRVGARCKELWRKADLHAREQPPGPRGTHRHLQQRDVPHLLLRFGACELRHAEAFPHGGRAPRHRHRLGHRAGHGGHVADRARRNRAYPQRQLPRGRAAHRLRRAGGIPDRRLVRAMRSALAGDWFLPRMGGIELHLGDLALAMCARGLDARVVTTTDGPAHVDGVPVHRIPTLRLPQSGVAVSPLLGRAISRAIRDEGFDLVHAHVSVVSPTAYTSAVAASRMGIPTVLTFHSMLHRASLFLGATDALLGWTDGIVLTAVSSVVARQAASWMSGASVGVLPNGVDVAFWQNAPRRRSSEDVHFVSAMRISRKKRPLELVRAFADAHRFVAGTPTMRLTIAGDGPARAPAKRLAAELGIADRVSLPGHLSRDELRALYRDADVFVLPAQREAFAIPPLQT